MINYYKYDNVSICISFHYPANSSRDPLGVPDPQVENHWPIRKMEGRCVNITKLECYLLAVAIVYNILNTKLFQL